MAPMPRGRSRRNVGCGRHQAALPPPTGRGAGISQGRWSLGLKGPSGLEILPQNHPLQPRVRCEWCLPKGPGTDSFLSCAQRRLLFMGVRLSRARFPRNSQQCTLPVSRVGPVHFPGLISLGKGRETRPSVASGTGARSGCTCHE